MNVCVCSFVCVCACENPKTKKNKYFQQADRQAEHILFCCFEIEGRFWLLYPMVVLHTFSKVTVIKCMPLLVNNYSQQNNIKKYKIMQRFTHKDFKGNHFTLRTFIHTQNNMNRIFDIKLTARVNKKNASEKSSVLHTEISNKIAINLEKKN